MATSFPPSSPTSGRAQTSTSVGKAASIGAGGLPPYALLINRYRCSPALGAVGLISVYTEQWLKRHLPIRGAQRCKTVCFHSHSGAVGGNRLDLLPMCGLGSLGWLRVLFSRGCCPVDTAGKPGDVFAGTPRSLSAPPFSL